MQTLDLDWLWSLAAIVVHDGFAAAAVYLDRTQSAMTQQMQRLEQQMGIRRLKNRGATSA